MSRRREPTTARDLPPVRKDPTDEQAELCERHQEEALKLAQKHRDQELALRLRQERERVRLERRQVLQLGELWRRQGRTVGPGMQRVLEGGTGGFRGTR